MPFDVFRNGDFVVRAVTGFDSSVCVVTFDSYSDLRTLDRPGFGERFFDENRVDAIHVIARANDWYQHDDIFEICRAVAAIASNYRRVYAYGSSMGGYAAIRFGALVGAKAAIALSPQFSIDKSIVPFERRWSGDAKRIRFVAERKTDHSFAPLAYVSYDPFDLDRRHVELFREKTALIELAIPHGGHPVTGFLAEAGLLGEFALSVVQERVDIPGLKAKAHARRKQTPQFWGVLSERARNPNTRAALAQRALSLAPHDVGYQIRYARVLAQNGAYEESEALFRQALKEQPTNPVLLHSISEMYELSGDYEAALHAARRLVETHPDAHIYGDRVAQLTNRIRVSTVMANVCNVAHNGLGPLNAMICRARDRIGVRARPQGYSYGSGRALPVDILVTTTPAPPPFVHSWLRHLDLLRDAPRAPIDLLLIGDSYVHYWPPERWGSFAVCNLGVAADKTQHILWRLSELADASVQARDVILLAGTNNLGADDTPRGIEAGVAAVVREIARIAPGARTHVVAIPPCGENLEFRDRDRRNANGLIRSRFPHEFVEADDLLRQRREGAYACYQEDNIHLSAHGYEVLTETMMRRVRS